MSSRKEIPLVGGRVTAGVVRVGDTVRRPIGPHAPFVHALLRQLEARGFTGAPRLLGLDDQGREVLTFVDGHVPHEKVSWPDSRLVSIARLVRALHDATVGTNLAGEQEVVCHHDLAPWNTVVSGGVPVAFIDFDGARPGRRVDDFGYALWVFLDLGCSPACAGEQARRARVMCDAYGALDPDTVLHAVRSQQQRVLAFREAQAAGARDLGSRVLSTQRASDVRSAMGWMSEHDGALRAVLAA